MTKRKDPKDCKTRGKKPLYTDPDVMQKKIEEYFELSAIGEEKTWISKKGEAQTGILPIPPTIEGLALHLGFCSVSALEGYQSKPKFKSVLTGARTILSRNLNNMAMRNEVDPRYSLVVAARIDPAYRKQVDVQVNEDASKQLQEAIGRVKKAKKVVNKAK